MASTKDPQGSTAVWYFIAAVFVLVLPNLLFPDVNLVLRIVILVAGVALMAVGFVHLRRETSAKNGPAEDDGSSRDDT